MARHGEHARSTGRRTDGRDPIPLRIASYNIHRGYGRDGRQDLDRVATVLDEIGADVLAIQEVDSDPETEGILDHIAHLAKATGFQSVSGPTLRRGGAAYGNLLLTRGSLGRILHVDLCIGRREPRGAIDAETVLLGVEVRVVVTHLGLRFRERREQVARLVEQLRPRGERVLVLAGDFNEWSPFGRTLGPLRRALGAGTSHATFPSRLPFLSLDKIFVSPASAAVRSWVHRSGAARRASDHLPIVVDVDLRTVAPRAV